MNIYLLTQRDNTGYDTYNGVVVVANNEEEARNINPGVYWGDDFDGEAKGLSSWANNPGTVEVTLLGLYTGNDKEARIILESSNLRRF